MTANAFLFMAGAWCFVLGLTSWSWYRLLKLPPGQEKVPPPGTSL